MKKKRICFENNDEYERFAQNMGVFYDHQEDGQFIRRWKSTKEAEQQLGISYGSICHCLKGRHKTSGGFVWRFAS